MRLHYLKIFHSLATHLSYSKAAKELYISQPAVSMQIKKLEEELGCKLFDKVGRKIQLNNYGKILYEYTKQIFCLIDDAKRSIDSQSYTVSGSVAIGASNTPGSYIMPFIIGDFMKKYDQVTVSLHVGNTAEVENMLLTGQIDFGILGGTPINTSKIAYEKACSDDLIVVASPTNALVRKENLLPSDFDHCNIITHDKSSNLYAATKEFLEALGIHSTTSMHFGEVDAIKQAAMADLGIGFVPRSSAKLELEAGFLKEIPIYGVKFRYPYNIVQLKNTQMTHATSKLLEYVKETIQDTMDQNVKQYLVATPE